MFENTATYFGELLMQEGGQGAEKWQRLSFFLSVSGFRDCRGLQKFILDRGLQHFDNC